MLTTGGFAHVYIVRLKEKMKLADGSVGDVACLKRVVAPDKEALGIVRTEVDTMVETVLLCFLQVETTERPSTCCYVHRLACLRACAGRL
jgi:hypothetical protein